MQHLAGRPVRVLADHPEVRASDVLAGAAPLARPVADDRVDHDLVPWPPRRIAGRLDHAGAIGGDHPRRGHALRPMRQEEVQVVDRSGSNCNRHRPGDRLRAGPGSNPNPGRPERLLVHGRPTLAQNRDARGPRRGHLRNLTKIRPCRLERNPTVNILVPRQCGLSSCFSPSAVSFCQRSPRRLTRRCLQATSQSSTRDGRTRARSTMGRSRTGMARSGRGRRRERS